MTDENKPQSVKEEKALSVLEQVKLERAEAERVLEESQKVRDELRELRSMEALGGRTDAGKNQAEKPKEVTLEEYAQNALKGVIK